MFGLILGMDKKFSFLNFIRNFEMVLPVKYHDLLGVKNDNKNN